MQNFLDILSKEKSLVDEINCYDNYISITQDQLDRIQKGESKCESYQHDVKALTKVIEKFRTEQAALQKKLDNCRVELREYLINLLNLDMH